MSQEASAGRGEQACRALRVFAMAGLCAAVVLLTTTPSIAGQPPDSPAARADAAMAKGHHAAAARAYLEAAEQTGDVSFQGKAAEAFLAMGTPRAIEEARKAAQTFSDGATTPEAAAEAEALLKRIDQAAHGPPSTAPVAPPAEPPAVAPPTAAPDPPASQAPPPPPTAGTLLITASEPGDIFVDGREVGWFHKKPLKIRGVAVGRHEVRVEFDEGGEGEEEIVVSGGRAVTVRLEPSASEQIYRHRAGASIGIGVGGFAMLDVVGPAGAAPGGGGTVELTVSGAFSQAVEFRFAPQVAVGAFATEWNTSNEGCLYSCSSNPEENRRTDSEFGLAVSALLALRGNIGTYYSIWLGFRGGVDVRLVDTYSEQRTESDLLHGGERSYKRTFTPANVVEPHWGPELSPASFRFGEMREFEIDLAIGVFLPGEARVVSPHGDLTFRYMFLD